jgi:hypothetical protein
MANPSGVGLAMKYFGKKTMPDGNQQTLVQFRDEWNELPDEWKAQIAQGLLDGTETY